MKLTIKDQKNVQFKDLKELNKSINKLNNSTTETPFVKKEAGQVLFHDSESNSYGLTVNTSHSVSDFKVISNYMTTGRLAIQTDHDNITENWVIIPDNVKLEKAL